MGTAPDQLLLGAAENLCLIHYYWPFPRCGRSLLSCPVCCCWAPLWGKSLAFLPSRFAASQLGTHCVMIGGSVQPCSVLLEALHLPAWDSQCLCRPRHSLNTRQGWRAWKIQIQKGRYRDWLLIGTVGAVLQAFLCDSGICIKCLSLFGRRECYISSLLERKIKIRSQKVNKNPN